MFCLVFRRGKWINISVEKRMRKYCMSTTYNFKHHAWQCMYNAVVNDSLSREARWFLTARNISIVTYSRNVQIPSSLPIYLIVRCKCYDVYADCFETWHIKLLCKIFPTCVVFMQAYTLFSKIRILYLIQTFPFVSRENTLNLHNSY